MENYGTFTTRSHPQNSHEEQPTRSPQRRRNQRTTPRPTSASQHPPQTPTHHRGQHLPVAFRVAGGNSFAVSTTLRAHRSPAVLCPHRTQSLRGQPLQAEGNQHPACTENTSCVANHPALTTNRPQPAMPSRGQLPRAGMPRAGSSPYRCGTFIAHQQTSTK